jgi:serine/threonine protein kinase
VEGSSTVDQFATGDRAGAFVVFDEQDSACVSYGTVVDGKRWFVKRATTAAAARSLRNAVVVHDAVRHDTIVAPAHVVVDVTGRPILVYKWCEGIVLNQATRHRSDRSGLARFQSLPVVEVAEALGAILSAHLAVSAAGYVAVDLYDGCFLYDFDAHVMRLIDLDEYRPGPFTVEADRLPGSRRYMAPEEHLRGAVIDERTTVFNLGRTLFHLLDSASGWRGTAAQRAVVDTATRPSPSDRFADVASLAGAWHRASGGA